MNFNTELLEQTNKKYKKKKPVVFKILNTILYSCIFVLLCVIVFSSIFIKAQVIGISMQPIFNKNLQQSVNKQDYENSIYKDIAFANRFKKGSSGDIVLIQLKENNKGEVIIKRVIATEGQRLTLKKAENSDIFYYYVNGVKLNEDYILSQTCQNLAYFATRFCDLEGVTIVQEDVEAEIIIPENSYFVLGDNRLNSVDSTVFGLVEEDEILGKIEFYYEYNQTFFGFIWQQLKLIF